MSCCCCCFGAGSAGDGEYTLTVDQRRRAAWRARFKTLLTSLQVQLGARPKGLHPRDQVFDGIMHLYAHEVRRAPPPRERRSRADKRRGGNRSLLTSPSPPDPACDPLSSRTLTK